MNGSFTALSKTDLKRKNPNTDIKKLKKYTLEFFDYHQHTVTQEGKSAEYNQKKERKKERTGFNI